MKIISIVSFTYFFDLWFDEITVGRNNKGTLIPFLLRHEPSSNYSSSSMHGYFPRTTTWNPFFSLWEHSFSWETFFQWIGSREGYSFAICSRFYGILFSCHNIIAYCTDYNLLKLRVFGFPRVLAILNLVKRKRKQLIPVDYQTLVKNLMQ